jgi:hypothetical protein
MEELLPPSEINQVEDLPQPPRSYLPILIVVLVGVILGSSYLYLQATYPAVFASPIKHIYNAINPESRRAASTEATPLPSPTRSPYPLIPDQGSAGTYKVSHVTPSGPKITNVTIDPLDAKVGDTTTVTLTLTHPSNIQKIAATVDTDTKPLTLSFTQQSRTDTTEIWQTKFKLTNLILYTYIYHFEASDGTNTSQLSMALRN